MIFAFFNLLNYSNVEENMKWIQKYKKIIIVIFIILIGNPLLVHCLFKLKSQNNFFTAEWSAGEILTYIVTSMSVLSTLVLSLLTIWLNEKIREESVQYRKQIEVMELKKNAPLFYANCEKSINSCQNMSILFKNVSENIAKDVFVNVLKIERNGNILWNKNNTFISNLFLPLEQNTCKFQNPNLALNDRIIMELIYKDIFDNQISIYYIGNYNAIENRIIFYVEKIKYFSEGKATK